MEDSINLWLKNNLALVQIIGGLLFFFLVIVPIIRLYFSSESKSEREIKRERKKQERIELAEEVKNRRKEKEQEILEQQKEHKEEEYKKYFNWRKRIEQMPIYERWKQDVINKCGNKCQIDKSHADRYAEVHHLISLSKILRQNNIISIEGALGCRMLWDVDNGVVLCKECHDQMESSQIRQTILSKNNK